MSISQREARRLRRRVAYLEEIFRGQRNAWLMNYPLGVNIDSIELSSTDTAVTAISTARKLGHAVVCTLDMTHGRTVQLYAVKLPDEST